MKILIPRHDYDAIANKLEGKHPASSHIDRIITRSTKVITQERALIAVYLPHRIEPRLREAAYDVCRAAARDRVDNRSTAAGAPSLPRIRKDGQLSNRRAVPARVLKVLDRRGVRQGTLRIGTHRKELEKTAPLLERVRHLFKRYLNESYRVQRTAAKNSRDRIPRTPFTVIHVNKNLRSAYHRDEGNLLHTLSVITVLGGDYKGGALCFPRYRIAFALRPGDVLFFAGRELLHGNLSITGTRLSAICYCERLSDE
jgi:hypothetical protein